MLYQVNVDTVVKYVIVWFLCRNQVTPYYMGLKTYSENLCWICAPLPTPSTVKSDFILCYQPNYYWMSMICLIVIFIIKELHGVVFISIISVFIFVLSNNACSFIVVYVVFWTLATLKRIITPNNVIQNGIVSLKILFYTSM